MKISICCFLFCFPLSISLFAQNNLGARLFALGNNGAAVADIWSVKANIANISYLERPELSLNYGKYAINTELSNQSIAFVTPVYDFHLGFHLQKVGINSFNEQKIGLVSAKKFGKNLALALGVNLQQIMANNYGKAKTYSLDVGLSYSINPQNSFGFYIQNLSKSSYPTTNINGQISSAYQLGYCYKNSDKVLLATTISKIIDEDIDVKIGLEYKIIPILSLRGGINTKPYKQFGGVGLAYKKIKSDVAFSNENNLGYAPQISIGYAF